MPAGSIVVDLIARTGGFVTDIDRSTKAAEKRMREFEKTAVSAGKAIGASLLAAGTAAVYFGKQVVDGLDALNDVADATGASIENISALEDVALRTGASLEDVSGILVKFNNVLKEADGRNGVSQALESIGLNAEELKRLDPAEALRQTAVALAQFADDGNKARITQELFGKSVKDAAPFLKDLAEAGQLNATVTADQAAAAEEFNKNIFALQANVTQLARDLSGPLVDSLNEVVKFFAAGRAAGKGFLEIGVDNYIRQVKEIYGIAPPNMGGATGSWGPPEETRPSVPQFVGPPVPTSRPISRASSPRESEFSKYLDSLKKQLDRVKELSTEEQLLSDIQEGRLGKLNTQQQETLVNLAKQVDLHKRLEEQVEFEGEGYKFLAEEQKKFADEAVRINEETRTPFEVYTKGLEDLDKLLAGSFITLETYTRATQKLGDEYVNSGNKVEEATEEFSEFAKQAQRNIQDALGNTLEDALSGNFDNIGKMWLKLIQQMAAQALAARLNEQLFGKGGSGGVDWGSLFSSVAGAFSGGGGAGLAIGMDSVPYDNFPALLHRGERVMTAADNKAFSSGQGMGGSVNITQNIQVGSNVSLPDVKAAMETTKQETLAVIARSRRQEYTR
jgi:hypothetical protein